MMKSILRNSQAIVGFARDIKYLKNKYKNNQNSAIKVYLSTTETPCLHIGSGPTPLDGWLSTDFVLHNKHTVFLDGTKPFPISDNSFQYIFCEHMIEHIPHADAQNMLKECRRVLKPGGVLRIATPNFAFIMSLYNNPGAEQKEYIQWISRTIMLNKIAPRACDVINNAFHAWGHQFLYDAETLELDLEAAGFKEIVPERYNESRHPRLRQIEKHGVNSGSEQMAIRETFILEAS